MRGALSRICVLSSVLLLACGGDDGGPSPTDIDASVGIDAPSIDARLAIDRDQANLGRIIIGDVSPEAVFTISNPGADRTGTLTVAVAGAGFRISRNGCAGNALSPSASCDVAVEVVPTAAGDLTGTLTVTATPGGEVHAALTATGVAPGALMAMPETFGFGTVTAGTLSPPTTISIKNTGGADTGQVGVSLAGADAAEFEITSNGCAGNTLAAGDSCPVAVRMRPSSLSSGAKAATLMASANPGGSTMTTLTGNVSRPAVIAITGSGGFGGVLVGTTATRTLTVTNTGEEATGTITLNRTGSASFQVLAGMAGDCVSGTTTLAPAATCALRIQYTASVPGPVIGTISASATPGGSAMASLTGTGQRPARLSGDLTSSFGAVEVGMVSTNPIQWTITNAGDQASGVPMLTNPNPELVVSANTCTVAIPGGGTCVVTLRFQPSAGGPRSATATVAIVGSMVTATMTATGAYRVTLTRNGDAGTVTSNPAGFNCAAPSFSCTALFAPGNVTLQARTSNGSLVYFGAWSGPSAGACASGPARDCALTVDGPEMITATFLPMNHNLAFVSSTTLATNLGGTAPYDAACNDLATAAGINDAGGAAYIAWMSDASGNALTRLGGAAGWLRIDGRVVAVDRNSLLVAQRILNPVRYSELGEDLGDATLMTGTREDGTVTAGATCANWTSTGGTTMTTGNGMGGPTYWSAGLSTGCTAATYHVLCLMKTSASGPGAPPTTVGKRLWLSNAAYAPDPLGDPDAVCNADRPVGVAMGRALIARAASTAASKLTAASLYVRPDGQEVGTGAEIVAGEARGGIWQSGNGSYWSGQAWTGSSTIDALGVFTSTCGDWTVGSTTGRYTLPQLARRFWGQTLPVIVCNNIPASGPRLQCYEP